MAFFSLKFVIPRIKIVMKRFMLAIAIAAGIFTVSSAHAQVSVNVNIGTQPVWGPTGYDHVDYYYMPDIDAYYYVPKQQYVYREGNNWVFRKTLPPQYKNYDVYKNYKVVINEKKPWMRDDEYKKKYESFRNRHDQAVIRDSQDSKYFVNKHHPEHDKWVKQHGAKDRHH
jgi:hypothetical protein